MSSKIFAGLKDKRVLVTGGSRGIGREIVIALIHQGAKVTALGKTTSDLNSLKEEYPTVSTLCVDLTDLDKTREVLAPLEFDVLVNNAGIQAEKVPLMDTPLSSFDELFNINLKCVMNVSQAVVGNMVKGGVKGVVINISSLSSHRVFVGNGLYACTKAALDTLTKYMAVELGGQGIRVNSVNPGGVSTPDLLEKLRMAESFQDPNWMMVKGRTPFEGSCGGGPVVSMGEVVSTILFLLSEGASGITGQHILIDNGYTAS